MAALTLALAAAAVGALPNMNGVLPNMNGVYYIQDGNSTDSGSHTNTAFNTNFSSYPARGRPNNTVKYVEAYSEEISTLYSQVWWTMGPVYRFPSGFITDFDNKVCVSVSVRLCCLCACGPCRPALPVTY